LLLLEYRNLQIELPYQKEGPLFSIPDNVYVIGTMNTTDRSLSQIDYALRRRFFFYRLLPVASGAAPVLRKWLEAKSGFSPENQDAILKLFLNLNERIRKELGEHFQIGHSYFMNVEIGTDSGRKQVWDFAIMPLLEEYFYNRRDRASLLSEFAVDKLIKTNDDAQAASA
jgi:5-methylcytosine-specific restriction protein B